MQVIRILLDSGASIEAVDNEGNSPLNLAASDSQLEIIQLLLEHGASVHSANKRGNAALHTAAGRHSDPRVVRLLIQNGASLTAINVRGDTALHQAARLSCSEDVVRELLHHGASISALNQLGKSPVHYARRSGRANIWRVFEEKRASTEEVNADDESLSPYFRCYFSQEFSRLVMQQVSCQDANSDLDSS